MKKTTILLLSALLALGISACNKKPSSNPTSSEETSQEDSSTPTSSEVEGFTVRFETNGGTPVADMVGVTRIETAPVTTREGYDFVAWYRNASFLTKAIFPMNVTRDITLYAKWEQTEITPDGLFVLESNNGLSSAKAYIAVEYKDTVLSVTLNVKDKTIYNSFTNGDGSLNGMNDNVELFVSPISHQTVGLLQNETYKVMVVPGVNYEVRTFDYSQDGYKGSFVYSDAITTSGITATNTIRTIEVDEYRGYTATINVPYDLFSMNKASAINNLSLYLAMRNTDTASITNYAESDYLYAQRRNAWTHWLVNEDGSMHVRDVNTILLGDSYTDSQFYRTLNSNFVGNEFYGSGISGSKVSEWYNNYLGYFDRISLRHPQKLVINLGVNDIHAGDKSGETTFHSIQALISKLRTELPSVEIYWTTICNNYFSAAMKNGVNEYATAYNYVNENLKTYAATLDYLNVIDLNAKINRDRSMFISDGLHLNEMGYNIFTKLISQTLGYSYTDGTLFGQAGVLETSRGYDLSHDNEGTVSTNGDSDQYAFVKTTDGFSNFTFELSFTAQAIKHGDSYPKMGIVVKNGEKVLFYYIEMYAQLSNRQVGYVFGENYSPNTGWNYHWGTEHLSSQIEGLSYTGTNSAKLKLVNTDGNVTLYVNDALVFTANGALDSALPSYPGIMSFNTAFEAKNITFTH